MFFRSRFPGNLNFGRLIFSAYIFTSLSVGWWVDGWVTETFVCVCVVMRCEYNDMISFHFPIYHNWQQQFGIAGH